MDNSDLTREQRNNRINIRNFFLAASVTELKVALDSSNGERKRFIQELLEEALDEQPSSKGHCHGCNRYTSQNEKLIDGNKLAWVCKHCTFQNAKLHECDEDGSFLHCTDCKRTVV